MTDLFGQYLVSNQVISEDRLNQCIEACTLADIALTRYLAEQKIIPSLDLSQHIANYYDLPIYDLSCQRIENIDTDLLSFSIVKSGYGIPIHTDDHQIIMAITDPVYDHMHKSTAHQSKSLKEYAFVANKEVKYVIVEHEKFDHCLEKLNIDKSTSIKESINDLTANLMSEFENVDLDLEEAETEETIGDLDHQETPIVHFVNKILLDAIQSHSSDIHFEPYEHECRIRFRQDGILYQMVKPPKQLSSSIVARIKVMSNLDISEHRVPQDGRFKIRIGKGRSIDFRVSTCPTLYGEKVVMRILDAESTPLVVDDLGMEDFQKQHYLDAIEQSQGMILVTGPTGSGKTVSLYTALGILNTSEKNISTIEDPIEINMYGVNQVQVNNKAGLTFASALRSFLRQDPDIVMVGEIRDLETAEIAVKASQTGHLVLSTLHTNNAPVTLARLANMGVELFNIASSVILVMAQRLVRKLCEHCKREVHYDDEVLLEQGFTQEQIKNVTLFEAVGCPLCSNGYKGRVGIYEVMPISPEMTSIIMENGNTLAIKHQAKKEGVLDLRESGLLKVMRGITTLQEVNRVIAS